MEECDMLNPQEISDEEMSLPKSKETSELLIALPAPKPKMLATKSKERRSSKQFEPPTKILTPFQGRLETKKPKDDTIDFMKVFGKLEINLPFLEVLKLLPLSKILKDFIVGKIVIGENVSAVIQKRLLLKCTDTKIFSLPIWIGDMKVDKAMCDLDASINVMPLSLYNSLAGVELADTRVVTQLAYRSCISPEGILENVLVRVHDFLYPTNFYVIKMNDVLTRENSGVLLVVLRQFSLC